MSNTIKDEMQAMTTNWIGITTYQAESESNELIEYVIRCVRDLKSDEFIELLPAVVGREWKALSATTKTEQQIVLTLSASHTDIWKEPARTDFDARIYVSWNDWGLGRLEIAGPKAVTLDRIFEVLGTLAMKAKLAA